MKRFFALFLVFVPVLVFSQTQGAFSPRTAGGSSDERLFQDAENRLAAGDYLLAEELYRRLVDTYPLSAYGPDAQFRISECLYSFGRHQEALGQLDLVSRRYSSTRFRPVLPFWYGMNYYKLGRYGEAQHYLALFLEPPAAVRESGRRGEALLYISLSLKALGRYPEARPYLEELYPSLPEGADRYYVQVLLGNLYLQTGDFGSLGVLLEGSESRDVPAPWGEHLKFLRAESLLAAGNTQAASELYRELTGGPDSASGGSASRDSASGIAGAAYLRLFSLIQDAGDPEALMALLDSAEMNLRSQPEILRDFWLRVGIEFYKLGRIGDSDFYLRRVWNSPDRENLSPLVPLYLARIANLQGEWERGVSYIDSYMEVSSLEREWLLYSKGELLTRAGRMDEAWALWSAFLTEYPLSVLVPHASYYGAYAAYHLGLNREALDRALSLNLMGLGGEQRKGVMKLKARLYGRLADYAAADKAWKEYLTLYPDDREARAEAMRNSFFAQDYQTVIAESLILSRQITTSADDALYIMASYFAGLAHLSLANWPAALDTLMPLTEDRLRRAGMGDLYPWILYYRGWSYYRTSRYDRALEDFAELAGGSPEPGGVSGAGEGFLFGHLEGAADLRTLSDKAAYLAGWSAFQLRDYGTAGRFFLKSAALGGPAEPGQGPSAPAGQVQEAERSRFMYARSLVESGELQAGASVFEELAKNAGSALSDDALFELAGVRERLGNLEDAQNAYLDLYRWFPASPLAEESLYKRGENYMAAENWEKASEAFYLSRQAFPNGPLTGAAYYWGGEAASRSGEQFGAVLLWERLIQQFPGSPFRPVAMGKTADAYAARGDYSRALDLYLELNLTYPREAREWDTPRTIETLRLLSHGESAETAELRAVITTGGGLESPESREAMLELAEILIYRGGRDREDGKLYLEDLIFYREEDLHRAARAQYYLGEYYFRQARFDQAGEEYLKAAAMNPQDTELMAMSILRAAEAYNSAGRTQDVRALVKRLEENFPQTAWAEEGRKLLGGAP